MKWASPHLANQLNITSFSKIIIKNLILFCARSEKCCAQVLQLEGTLLPRFWVLICHVMPGCFALSCPKNFSAQSDPVLFYASDNKRLELEQVCRPSIELKEGPAFRKNEQGFARKALVDVRTLQAAGLSPEETMLLKESAAMPGLALSVMANMSNRMWVQSNQAW